MLTGDCISNLKLHELRAAIFLQELFEKNQELMEKNPEMRAKSPYKSLPDLLFDSIIQFWRDNKNSTIMKTLLTYISRQQMNQRVFSLVQSKKLDMFEATELIKLHDLENGVAIDTPQLFNNEEYSA